MSPSETPRVRDPRPSFLEQPIEFRSDPAVPEWVYFPSLHALFGLGAGLRETFRNGMFYGVRNIFVLGTDLEKMTPSPILLAEQHQRHYAHNTKLRDHLPPLVVDCTDGERLHRMMETSSGYEVVPSARVKPRTLSARIDYAVGTSKNADDQAEFTLFRRIQRLKPDWSKKRDAESTDEFGDWVKAFYHQRLEDREKELRRIYESHLRYLENREQLSEPAVQHNARKIGQAAVLKKLGLGQKPKTRGKSYGKKQPQPTKTALEPTLPSRLPAPTEPLPETIRQEMSRIARQRIGEMERNEHEWVTKKVRRPKKQHSELELLKRAINAMARRDVAAMLYDYSLEPVVRFGINGLQPANGESVTTTPSINP